MAADKKVVVVTTTLKEPADPDAGKYHEVYRHNLTLLANLPESVSVRLVPSLHPCFNPSLKVLFPGQSTIRQSFTARGSARTIKIPCIFPC
jgi:hypothetical protein